VQQLGGNEKADGTRGADGTGEEPQMRSPYSSIKPARTSDTSNRATPDAVSAR
jgi:hypothetical protein